MKASEFDKKFDSGEDITEFLNLTQAKRPRLTMKRINVDVPSCMVDCLDKKAHRIGTSAKPSSNSG